MASIISAGTTSGTALNLSGDTTGNLAFTTQAGANTITVPNATGTMLTTGSPQSGGVIQVVNGTYSTQTTTTSTSPVTSGFSVSITPKFSTSKILVIASCSVGIVTNGVGVVLQLWRGGSSIFGLNPVANYLNLTGVTVNQLNETITQTYLDSPATTSSVTYTPYFATLNASTAFFCINANPSTITLMEIAA